MFSPLTVKTPIARAPTRPASCANRILGTLPRAPSEIFTSIQFKIVLHCWRHFFSDTTSNCAPVPRLAQPQAGNFYYAELICCSASNPRIALNSLEDPAAQPRYHPPAAPRVGAPGTRQPRAGLLWCAPGSKHIKRFYFIRQGFAHKE